MCINILFQYFILTFYFNILFKLVVTALEIGPKNTNLGMKFTYFSYLLIFAQGTKSKAKVRS